jgi:hypothetical protein
VVAYGALFHPLASLQKHFISKTHYRPQNGPPNLIKSQCLLFEALTGCEKCVNWHQQVGITKAFIPLDFTSTSVSPGRPRLP